MRTIGSKPFLPTTSRTNQYGQHTFEVIWQIDNGKGFPRPTHDRIIRINCSHFMLVLTTTILWSNPSNPWWPNISEKWATQKDYHSNQNRCHPDNSDGRSTNLYPHDSSNFYCSDDESSVTFTSAVNNYDSSPIGYLKTHSHEEDLMRSSEQPQHQWTVEKTFRPVRRIVIATNITSMRNCPTLSSYPTKGQPDLSFVSGSCSEYEGAIDTNKENSIPLTLFFSDSSSNSKLSCSRKSKNTTNHIAINLLNLTLYYQVKSALKKEVCPKWLHRQQMIRQLRFLTSKK